MLLECCMIYECVINVSESKNSKILNEISTKINENVLLDIHKDDDHNRSVFTLGSKNLQEIFSETKSLINSCFQNLDVNLHDGVHPRIGVVDVVPFVMYDENIGIINIDEQSEFLNSIQNFGKQINKVFEVPIFYYDFASNKKHTLPQIRKFGFNDIEPDVGKNKPHEKYGAIAMSARQPLIAINVNLDSNDLEVAKSIAKLVRESSGGIPGVRALGLNLHSQSKVQVSMNIVDLKKANAGDVCVTVRNIAKDFGTDGEVELVGLRPKFHFETFSNEFLRWSNLDENGTIESRI